MHLPGETTNPMMRGLRPFSEGDLEPLARLLWEANSWPPTAPPTTEDLILRWKRRNIDPTYDVKVLDGRMGSLAACVQSGLLKDGTPRLSFEIAVHPYWRRQGLGDALFETVVTRAQRSGVNSLTTPVYTLPGAVSDASVVWLQHNNFRREHSYWQLRLDHIEKHSNAQWPAGVSFRTFSDFDRDPAIWADLIIRAFNETANPAGVLAQLHEPGVSPQGYFFAFDEASGREIGTSRARIDVMGGEQIGYIGTVGVLPEYRGRGIAAALLAQTLGYLASQGLGSATLFVEDQNHNARRLYDKLGWKYMYRTDHYWRRLTP